MASRSDVRVLYHLSPRLIFVDDPSTEIILQDLHDTLVDLEDEPANMIYENLISSAGKEALGGGVSVGITSTLNNARVGFEARKSWVSTGTVTTTSAGGTNLTDSGATFQSDGVSPGSWIVNLTDGSICSVLVVESEIQLLTNSLGGGSDNNFTSGDNYRIMNVVQMEVSGGNLVALDSLGGELDSIIPTAGTQVVRTSASSATTQSQLQLEHAVYGGGVHVDVTSIYDGTDFPVGTQQQPVNNTGDALSIAAARGFDTLFIIGNITIDSGQDYSDLIIEGASKTKTLITVSADANVINSEFQNASIVGVLDGGSKITDCSIGALNFIDGFVENCVLTDTVTLSGAGTAHFLNCHSGIPGSNTPVIDMAVSGSSLAIRNYNGGIRLINHTGTDPISIDMASGHVIVDSTVIAGIVLIRGITKVTDLSPITTTVDSSDAVVPARLTNNQYLIESFRPNHSGFGNVYFWNPENGDDTFDGLAPPRARKTLQSIIDNLVKSNNNDIVMALADGTGSLVIADETVIINKAYVFIRGPGRTIVMRPSVDPGVPTIDISADGVEISGLSVEGYTGAGPPQYAIKTSGSNTYLESLNVSLGDLGGVLFTDHSSSIIENSSIMDTGGSGIHIHDCLEHVIIKNCMIDDCIDGIKITASAPSTTDVVQIDDDNIIHGNTGYAINIGTGVSSTIIGASISMWKNTLGDILDNGTDTSYSGVLERQFTTDAVWDGVVEDHIIPGTAGETLRNNAYSGFIHINPTLGENGINFPLGTVTSPSSNITDAMTISALTGIRAFKLRGVISLVAATDGYSFESAGSILNDVIDMSGYSVTKTRFEQLTVTGTMLGDSTQFIECLLSNISGLAGLIFNCGLQSSIGLGGASTSVLGKDCLSIGGATIDMVGSDRTWIVEIDSGDFSFINSNSGSVIQATQSFGTVTLAASCVGGTAYVAGNGSLVDNSTMTVFDTTTNRANISDAVWDEAIADHTDITTFGGANQGTVAVDAYQIADAVWTTQASGYFNNNGSMGQTLGFTLASNTDVTSVVDASNLETTLTQANNYWVNHEAIIYDVSTGTRVVRNVSGYLQSNGLLTFSEDLPFTAAVGDVIMLITRSPATGVATVDNNAIAAAVWNKATSAHTTAGTFGRTAGFTGAAETTITGGTVSVIQTGLTQADNYWNDHQVIINDISSGEKVIRNISSFANTNGAITLNSDLPFTPVSGDPVMIITRNASTNAAVDAAAVASAVWEESLADHQTNSTFGSIGLSTENILRVLEFQRGTHTGANGIFYWDPYGGSDANDGLAPTTAKLTWSGASGANSLVTANKHNIVMIIPGDPTGNTIITEQIVIDKEYTFLRGPGRDIVFRPTATTGATVDVSAEGVEVSGVIIETANTGDGSAITISGDFCKITDVFVEYARENGIKLQNINFSRLDRIHVSDTGQGGSGDGIVMNGASQDCKFNFISNATIVNNVGNGLLMTGTNCQQNYVWGGEKGTTIVSNNGYGVLEQSGADYNHVIGPVIHIDDNLSGNTSLVGGNSIVENTTQWSTHDAYSAASAVWEETIGSHLDILTYGGFFANQSGFGPTPPQSTSVSTGSTRSFSGQGSTNIGFDTPINYLTVSVQKKSIQLSVDKGQTYINLIAGVHTFRVGLTKNVRIIGTETWQFIGERA